MASDYPELRSGREESVSVCHKPARAGLGWVVSGTVMAATAPGGEISVSLSHPAAQLTF